MISYGSGLPGGIFLPILALGSLLGALVGVICVNLGLVSQEQFPIFVISGNEWLFWSNIQSSLNCYDTCD